MITHVCSTPLMALGLLSLFSGRAAAADTVTCGAVKTMFQENGCCGQNDTTSFDAPECKSLQDLRRNQLLFPKLETAASRCVHALNLPPRTSFSMASTLDAFKVDLPSPIEGLTLKTLLRMGLSVVDGYPPMASADLNRRVLTVCEEFWGGDALEGKSLLEIGVNFGYHAFIFPTLAGRNGYTRITNDVNMDNYAFVQGGRGLNNTATYFSDLFPGLSGLAAANRWDWSPYEYAEGFEKYDESTKNVVFGQTDPNDPSSTRTYDLINVNNVFSRAFFNAYTKAELVTMFELFWNQLNSGGKMIVADWWNPLAEEPGAEDDTNPFARYNKGTVAMRNGRPSVYQWDGTEVTELGGSLVNRPHPDDPLFDAPEEPSIRDTYLKAPVDAIQEVHNYGAGHLLEMPWVAKTVPTANWTSVTGFIPNTGKSTPAAVMYYLEAAGIKDHCTVHTNRVPFTSGAEYVYDTYVFNYQGMAYRSVYHIVCEKPHQFTRDLTAWNMGYEIFRQAYTVDEATAVMTVSKQLRGFAGAVDAPDSQLDDDRQLFMTALDQKNTLTLPVVLLDEDVVEFVTAKIASWNAQADPLQAARSETTVTDFVNPATIGGATVHHIVEVLQRVSDGYHRVTLVFMETDSPFTGVNTTNTWRALPGRSDFTVPIFIPSR